MGRASDAKERLMKGLAELVWTGSYGSTTIDEICDRASVKKGSFYYFFNSKADLARESIHCGCEEFRSKLDTVFSPSLPPLERFHRYCELEYAEQAQLKQKYGYVLGCPLSTLGSEISTLEPELRQLIDEMMDRVRRYFETAIRDAHAAGQIVAPDAYAKSKIVFAYAEGLLTQARIRNDIETLKEMEPGILDILGAKIQAAA